VSLGARGRSTARTAGLALAILLVTIAAPQAGPQRYLVLPFENLSKEKSLTWLGEALALSVGDRLELMGMRTVSRDERLAAIESLGLASQGPLSVATSLRVASSARAGRLVTGSFSFQPGSGVSVSARLLDVAGAHEIWQGQRPGTLAGIFGLTDPLVMTAASRDASRLSPASPSSLSSISDPPLPLYEILIRAIQDNDPEHRIASLEKGLDMNRSSVPVLRALAEALEDAGRPDQALARLAALGDDTVPDAWRLHLMRARILAEKGDSGGALGALSKSVAAGDSADAHILAARLHVAAGRRDRAQAEMDLATGLDPGHPDLPNVRALLNKPPSGDTPAP
jgi:hypothetical protein